jgi:hypothetical protein
MLTGSILSDSIDVMAAMVRCFGAAKGDPNRGRRVSGSGGSVYSSKRSRSRNRENARGVSLGEPPILLSGKRSTNWLNTEEAVEQIRGRQAFHEFVLSGNEESLKQYYEAQRHSPILGSEEFIEQIKQPSAAVVREYPRYERRLIQAGPEHVIGEVVRQYKVTRDEIFRGKRGRENEARKWRCTWSSDIATGPYLRSQHTSAQAVTLQ